MEPVALGFTAALLMGLVFGAGPCNIACLPYLGPVFFGRVRPWPQVAAFSAGRIAGYVGLAAAAGALGHAATQMLESRLAGVVLGLAALATGLLLLLKRGRNMCVVRDGVAPAKADGAAAVQLFARRKANYMLPLSLFGMGVGMALNPCVPLATVLLAAAATASLLGGAWLGLGFGVGAVVLPALVFGWLMARFGREVRAQVGHWRPRLEQGAGVLLMIIGVFTTAGWVHP